MGMIIWLNGIQVRGIIFLIWLNSMKRKPPKIQMNFTRSLVPRVRWCIAGDSYKIRERCGLGGFLKSTLSCWELRVGNRNQTSPIPSPFYWKWSQSLFRFLFVSPFLLYLQIWIVLSCWPSFRWAEFVDVWATFDGVRREVSFCPFPPRTNYFVVCFREIGVIHVVICWDTSALSDYNCVARLIKRLLGWKTEIRGVCADAKPKRRRGAAQIFEFDNKINIFGAPLRKESCNTHQLSLPIWTQKNMRFHGQLW